MRITPKMVADLLEEKFGLKDGMEVYTITNNGLPNTKVWESASIFDWWSQTYRVAEVYTGYDEAEKAMARAKEIRLENEKKQLEARMAEVNEGLEKLRRSNEQQQ